AREQADAHALAARLDHRSRVALEHDPVALPKLKASLARLHPRAATQLDEHRWPARRDRRATQARQPQANVFRGRRARADLELAAAIGPGHVLHRSSPWVAGTGRRLCRVWRHGVRKERGDLCEFVPKARPEGITNPDS